jgi:hypothetical protein
LEGGGGCFCDEQKGDECRVAATWLQC